MPSSKNIPIELLAPARDKECAFAAIDHGADAVYIGAARFGARASAGNTDEDIAQVVRYAHPFGVKVYVTLNTLLEGEEELREARDLAWRMYRIGVDALIVQDERIRLLPDMPPISLHASTQMDNRTAEKVKDLAEQGYEQVVLARELTIEEIADIHRQVPQVPLEVFIHGAICVS
ncbi:MAG: peptidase U32 family protein, partial [Bacteroidaceae bacterium]|nr:peptidase U32 family protein [Bacteroidaceae bacterium]